MLLMFVFETPQCTVCQKAILNDIFMASDKKHCSDTCRSVNITKPKQQQPKQQQPKQTNSDGLILYTIKEKILSWF